MEKLVYEESMLWVSNDTFLGVIFIESATFPI